MEPTFEQHLYWQRLALQQAEIGASCGEVPVGAVLVVDNQVVAAAHNQVESDCSALNHAEMLVLKLASAKLKRWRLNDASLYVTLEPCPMCMMAMNLSRLGHLYFGAKDPRLGAAGSKIDLSAFSQSPQCVKVTAGLLADESSLLLKKFFCVRRAAKL